MSGRDPRCGPSIRRRGRAPGTRDEARSGAGAAAPGLADAAPDPARATDPGESPAAPQIRAPASAQPPHRPSTPPPRRRRRFVF